MTRTLGPAVVSLLLLTPHLEAQESGRLSPEGRKQARAERVPEGAIRVDGRLDDEAWARAAPIVDFVQKEPVEGAPPSEEMEVRILYDDTAIYIGARMYTRDGRAIQAPLGRRDEIEDQSELIIVSFDTFQDRMTAYGFGVSATGVRLDRFYPGDDETRFDAGFDPVWEARTHIEPDSWTAELWIPFSQLRFNRVLEQMWGLNIQRSTPTLNEMTYWVPVPRTERGWASRFGDLRGIEGVQPPRRIEVLPYLAGASTVDGNRDPRNPFDSGLNLGGRAGADLKMGIGPNLTLEATFNPDFGQVEADPAEVNLSAFETFFSEKRPFFTEGAGLLNLSQVNNFFYSRRIGARPTGPAVGDYVDYPAATTILGAAKLTGRLRSGTSLGVLAALTDEESARISHRESPDIEKIRVAPRTMYALARVQQEFGRAASTVAGMVSFVHRGLDENDTLAALLTRNAFMVAGDSILRFKGGEYELRSYGGLSYVDGEAPALARIQRSAVHYFQRPDKSYSPYDPTRRSLHGYKAGGTFERTGGRHWLWSVSTDWESNGYEPNDIGRLTSADGIRFNYGVRYRETRPGRLFRNYSIRLQNNNEWNYGGDRQSGNVRGEVNVTFLNFWAASVSTGPNFKYTEGRATRGGPLMTTPPGWTIVTTLSSRPAAKTVWNVRVTNTTDVDGGQMHDLNGGLSFRPGARWQLSLNPTYIRETDSQQYVTTLGGSRPEVYNQRYIFAYIDRSTVSTQLRVGYTLRPDLNVDVYAEPFAASGRYYDLGELLQPRARERLLYGTNGTTVLIQEDGSRRVTDGAASFTLRNGDFNVRSFRSNVVLRWEWRPGSTLYLVWQQNRRISEPFGDYVGIGDMFRSVTAPGRNFFAIKTSLWLSLK